VNNLNNTIAIKNEHMYINRKEDYMQILKDNIRNKILTAASTEFNDKGFENASMRKIAAKAGITPGNVYRYFKNKEGLLDAVVQPIMNDINQALLECTDGKISWTADIDELLNENETVNIDLKRFSELFVEINNKNRAGMSFIAKNQVYREQIKNWLIKTLGVYYSSRRKKVPAEFTVVMSSIAAVTLIDAVTESLKFEKECSQLHIKESDVVQQSISVILGAEEIMI